MTRTTYEQGWNAGYSGEARPDTGLAANADVTAAWLTGYADGTRDRAADENRDADVNGADFRRRELERDRKHDAGERDPDVAEYAALDGRTENQSYRAELAQRRLCRSCERPLEPERMNNRECLTCNLIRHKRERVREGKHRAARWYDRRIEAVLAGRPDPGPLNEQPAHVQERHK